MYNVTLRQSESKIERREDFKASSLMGYLRYDGSYVVYSYSTCIAEYRDGVWYVNDTHYSVTTSKHQHIVRMAMWATEYVTVIGVRYGADTLYDRIGATAVLRANRIRQHA
jgi:hypothetical protein